MFCRLFPSVWRSIVCLERAFRIAVTGTWIIDPCSEPTGRGQSRRYWSNTVVTDRVKKTASAIHTHTTTVYTLRSSYDTRQSDTVES